MSVAAETTAPPTACEWKKPAVGIVQLASMQSRPTRSAASGGTAARETTRTRKTCARGVATVMS